MILTQKTDPVLLLGVDADTEEQTQLNKKTLIAFLGEENLDFQEMFVRDRLSIKQTFMIPYLGADYGHLPNYLYAAGQRFAYFLSEDRLVYEIDRDKGKSTLIGDLTGRTPEDAVRCVPYFFDDTEQEFYVAKDFG